MLAGPPRQPCLSQLTRRQRLPYAYDDGAAEDLLEPLGLHRVGRRGAGHHPAQEPSRTVYADEASRLERRALTGGLDGDAGLELSAEGTLAVGRLPTRLAQRGGDLVPDLGPQTPRP